MEFGGIIVLKLSRESLRDWFFSNKAVTYKKKELVFY
jgi:hypothetical protein